MANNPRKKEICCNSLANLVGHGPSEIFLPYLDKCVSSLQVFLQESQNKVVAATLRAIGEIGKAGGHSNELIDRIFPKIISFLQEFHSSTIKQDAALSAITQLVRGSGKVIEPYLQYPTLLHSLINIIKNENNPSVRLNVLRVIGVLGAINPDGKGLRSIEHKLSALNANNNQRDDGMRDLVNSSSLHTPEIYANVVILAVLRILQETSSPTQQSLCIQAVMIVFKSLGRKYLTFLPNVVPAFIQVLKTCQPQVRTTLFQQLGILASETKQYIRPYLKDIVSQIKHFWDSQESIESSLGLVADISNALQDEFADELNDSLIPKMIDVLDSSHYNVSNKAHVLATFESLGVNLQRSAHLVLSSLVRLMSDEDIKLADTAIRTLSSLTKHVSISPYTTAIVHYVTQTLRKPPLFDSSLRLVCNLFRCVGFAFFDFVPAIEEAIGYHISSHHSPSHTESSRSLPNILSSESVHQIDERQPLSVYNNLVSKFRSAKTFSEQQALVFQMEKEKAAIQLAQSSENQVPSGLSFAQVAATQQVNIRNLSRAWDTSHCVTSRDWAEWLRGFTVALLAESPSPALRSCHNVALMYPPIATELFNASFVSCWKELDRIGKELLVQNLTNAIKSETIPADLLQTLLDLCEFMELDDLSLPIPKKMLGSYAQKSHAYAKALRYKEEQFKKDPNPLDVEGLVSLYSEVGHLGAANGLLEKYKNKLKLNENWYEKLGRWQEALDIYEQKLESNPTDANLHLGRLRCLKAFAKWDEISSVCDTLLQQKHDEETIRSLASFKSFAGYHLREWSSLNKFVNLMQQNSEDSYFLKAIIYNHEAKFDSAQALIKQRRLRIDTSFSALIGESYSRAYDDVVRLQLLAELEEIIEYNKQPSPSRKESLLHMWNKRLEGCQRSPQVFARILALRSVLLSPQENLEGWCKYASLANKTGNLTLCRNILSRLIQPNTLDAKNNQLLYEMAHNPKVPPRLVYTAMKYLWSCNEKEKAIEHLSLYCAKFAKLQVTTPNIFQVMQTHPKVLSKMLLCVAEWKKALSGAHQLTEVLDSCKIALHYDDKFYKVSLYLFSLYIHFISCFFFGKGVSLVGSHQL